MRVAVIIVSIVVMTTPSFASDACMTKAEARQHFATSYLYWHGPDHCWDANPMRRRSSHSIQQQADEKVRAPKWREALSELRPDAPNQPDVAVVANQSDAPREEEQNETTNDAPAPGKAWSDRWVDVVQVAPPVLNVHAPTRTVSASARISQLPIAGGIILIWLGIIVVVEFVRRSVRV